MKVFSIFASVLFVVSAITVAADAAPGTLPVLAKRINVTTPGGKTNSFECLIHPDGIVITRSLDGIMSTEEKTFRLSTDIKTRVDGIAAQVPVTSTMAPTGESYSFVAFRTSAAGIQETVDLFKYDGATGQHTEAVSMDAYVLRELMNSVCPLK